MENTSLEAMDCQCEVCDKHGNVLFMLDIVEAQVQIDMLRTSTNRDANQIVTKFGEWLVKKYVLATPLTYGQTWGIINSTDTLFTEFKKKQDATLRLLTTMELTPSLSAPSSY